MLPADLSLRVRFIGLRHGFAGAYFLRENYAKENEKREKLKITKTGESRERGFAFKITGNNQTKCI